jgi:hypothetical protein
MFGYIMSLIIYMIVVRKCNKKICSLICSTGINDTSSTGAKFTTGVVDMGGKFATGLSLIPVVHLDLQISP